MNREQALFELRRYMKQLAPGVDDAIHFTFSAHPNGVPLGSLRWRNAEGLEVHAGQFWFEPRTEVPGFRFTCNELLHLNGRMEYSRHEVMMRDAILALSRHYGVSTLAALLHTPADGSVYRHYKGRYYRVGACGRHSKTGEHMVSYIDLALGTWHYRPVWDTPLATDDAWTKPLPSGQLRFTVASDAAALVWIDQENRVAKAV